MNTESRGLDDEKCSEFVTNTGQTASIPSAKVLSLARVVVTSAECMVFAAVRISLSASGKT